MICSEMHSETSHLMTPSSKSKGRKPCKGNWGLHWIRIAAMCFLVGLNSCSDFGYDPLEEARKALAEGRIQDAKEHLYKIPAESPKWENDGRELMNKAWDAEKKKNQEPEEVKKALLKDQQFKEEVAQRDAETKKEHAKFDRKWKEERKKMGGVVNFDWSVEGFGIVGVIKSITIKNTSSETCRDMMGIMTFSAKSGTKLGDVPFTIYDTVPPYQTKTFRNINVGLLPTPADQVKSASVMLLNCK